METTNVLLDAKPGIQPTRTKGDPSSDLMDSRRGTDRENAPPPDTTYLTVARGFFAIFGGDGGRMVSSVPVPR